MEGKYAELRAALDAVPCIKWTASRATVHIPETEDWTGKDLSITGLDKQVARKLARYIADTNPAAIRALLAERDALREALTELCDEIDKHEIHAAISKTSISWFKRKARAALAQEQGQS